VAVAARVAAPTHTVTKGLNMAYFGTLSIPAVIFLLWFGMWLFPPPPSNKGLNDEQVRLLKKLESVPPAPQGFVRKLMTFMAHGPS
jgi:hypothetical protein